MNEQSTISSLKGIGEKTEKLFQKLNIFTIGDLLRHFPKGYEVYEEATPIAEIDEGRTVTVTGAIYGKVQVSGRTSMQVTTIYVKDITGTLRVVWFRMPFLRNTFQKGGVVTLRGKVVRRKGTLLMEQPEIFYPSELYEEKINTLQPNYALTAGLTNNAVVKAMKQAISYLDLKQDFLPPDVRTRYHLAEYNYAIQGIHFPVDKEEFYTARERLVFEEFLVFILALRQMKEKNEKSKNTFSFAIAEPVEQFMHKLPYELTGAQQKVWEEIKADLNGAHVMSRLVQGDVGSGKTIIALLGLLLAAVNGYQGALMAPTEVLAKQHFESICEMLEKHQIPACVELLTGSMTAKEKRMAYERIASGEAQIIVGTHALIQEKVKYHSLALVVTDEQHRFGVKQREKLAEKGNTPHILVMSATPIPRTLAIILYGDLDISVIDELPANRLPIKNCVVDTNYRKTAYQFMKKQVLEGRQCYVICPMIEENENLEAENVIDYAKTLQEEMGENIQVAYLHGKMKQSEKDVIMEQFGKREIQILVSTTVIEVGVNVPNATVMVIMDADRFGLSQLHQLRGRVGRGNKQSYAILVANPKTDSGKQRMKIMTETTNGFVLAEEDLKMRGSGEIFGTRQSGIPEFQVADLVEDYPILEEARKVASQIVATPNWREHPDWHLLSLYLEKKEHLD